MTASLNRIEVYFEIGKKRAFASAVDWPGWCRSGRDEATALQALYDYGPRYTRVLCAARLGFQAPAMAPSSDTRPVDDAELQRFQALLQACWRAFDEAAQAATGKGLRKGPRGGAWQLEKMEPESKLRD